MTAVLTFVIPLLALFAALAGLYFLIRAFSNRSSESRAAYNVEKQKAHQAMQVDLARSVFSFVVALILIGVFGLSPRDTEAEAVPTATTPAETATAVFTPTSAPTPTTSVPDVLPTATEAQTLPPTPTDLPTTEPPTAVPTNTATPQSRTATVNSEVGVWLRSEPNTESEQLEWLLNGTVLLLLDETATAENLAWQQVQTDQGLVGWVAVPFITYSDEP